MYYWAKYVFYDWVLAVLGTKLLLTILFRFLEVLIGLLILGKEKFEKAGIDILLMLLITSGYFSLIIILSSSSSSSISPDYMEGDLKLLTLIIGFSYNLLNILDFRYPNS